MISVSTEKLCSNQEIVPIKANFGSMSFEVALLVGLLYNLSKTQGDSLTRFKLSTYLSSKNPSAFISIVNFLQTPTADHFNRLISDESSPESLSAAITIIHSSLSEEFSNDSFIENFCKAFNTSVCIIGTSSVPSNYGEGSNIVKLLNSGQEFLIITEKISLADKVIELVNSIEDFSDRRKTKIKDIIKAYKSGTNETCGHNTKSYKTLCGKLHCVDCLKQVFYNKSWKDARCLCGAFVSAKNLLEVLNQA